MRTGVLFVSFVAALVAGVRLLNGPPEPLDGSAAAEAFAEGRARVVMEAIAALGPHETGSDAGAAVVQRIAEELRRIPGVEVTEQVERVTRVERAGLSLHATVHNVLARLPGTEPGAPPLLLMAHHDSPPFSPGGGDNASGVAVVIEVLRALAHGERPRNPVVVALTDAEETGLLGALAVQRHPWLTDVRVVLNQDAGGAGGRAMLLRTSPGARPLLEAFARAPRPHATVLTQRLLEGGALGGIETDFRPFLDRGVLGLDQTVYEDGYAYHSRLDTAGRVGRGLVQHAGENLLAVVRTLGRAPLPVAGPHQPVVFFDVAGRVLVIVPPWLMWLLAALAAALVALGSAVLARRWGLRRLLAGTGAILAAAGAGLLVSPLPGLALAAAGRAHAWFSTPWLLFPLAGGASLGAFFGVLALARKVVPSLAEGAGVAHLGGAALVSLVPLGVTLARVDVAAYLPLGWALALGLAVLTALASARLARGVIPLLAAAASLVWLETVEALVLGMVPRGGIIPTPFPVDLFLGPLIAGALLPLGFMFAQLTAPGRTAVVAALTSAAAALALVLLPTYTAHRPRRIILEHVDRDGAPPVVAYRILDYPRFSLPGARDVGPQRCVSLGYPALPTLELDAVPSLRPLPDVTLLSSQPVEGGRRVSLRVRDVGAVRTRLRFPPGVLRGWSFGPLAPEDADGGAVELLAIGNDGVTLDLELAGTSPVTVELGAFFTGTSPALEPILAGFPDTLVAMPLVARLSTQKL